MHQSKDTSNRMDKKARPILMLLTRDSPQTQRHAQTKSQGMEKRIIGKQQ